MHYFERELGMYDQTAHLMKFGLARIFVIYIFFHDTRQMYNLCMRL